MSDTFDSSQSTHRRSLLLLAVALVSVVPVSVMLRSVDDDATANAASLTAPPSADGIWVLGNSIFKTGVDPGELEALIGGPPVDFEYHGGHYTSLWYLIAANALPGVEHRPDLVVWGFRPAYAALPAFRQNRVNSTELFLVEGDQTYESLAEGIDKPDRNALELVADDLYSWVSRSGAFRARDEATSALSGAGLRLGAAVAEAVGTDGGRMVREEVIDGDRTLLDLLNQVTTGGAVQLAEERVVDGVGDFVVGDPADFSGSFIPVIADELDGLGYDQLVIIWPPRAKALGLPEPDEDRFVADAVSGLESSGYEVLNLYDDARFSGLDFYAEGDHFNSEGRSFITSLLAEELRSRGLVE